MEPSAFVERPDYRGHGVAHVGLPPGRPLRPSLLDGVEVEGGSVQFRTLSVDDVAVG